MLYLCGRSNAFMRLIMVSVAIKNPTCGEIITAFRESIRKKQEWQEGAEEEIRPMNIEARYPDYKRAVAKSLNAEIVNHFVEQTKQMQQWILQKCLLAMKPSNSSENTNG